MSERVYCTYFDHKYLSRGLALYHSLQRHAPGARLWVLCLSQQCFDALENAALACLTPIRLSSFEEADPEAAATRASRKEVEYYFTLTPSWILYVAAREATASWVTYLDGDLYFFSSPDPIYAELEGASAAIIPHRFTAKLKKLRRYGTYNVGWVGARNNALGLAIMQWWRKKCIEWCFDYVDGDRFADQGYLDQFAVRFEGVAVIENIGANLAPWNVGAYAISFESGQVLIDGKVPLIFFHFQGLRKAWNSFVFNSHRIHRAPLVRVVREQVYKPYIDEMLAIEAALGPMQAAAVNPHVRRTAPDLPTLLCNMLRKGAEGGLRLLDVVTRRAFVIVRGKAY